MTEKDPWGGGRAFDTRAMYIGSELAHARGWTDEYLTEHFVVVKAIYTIEYDHTKTPIDGGYTISYFYLTQVIESGKWIISDYWEHGPTRLEWSICHCYRCSRRCNRYCSEKPRLYPESASHWR